MTDSKIKHQSAQKEVKDRKAECARCSEDKQRLVSEANAVGDARSLRRNLNSAESAVASASAEVESGASKAVVLAGRDRIEAIKRERHELKDEIEDLTDQLKKREVERSGWASLDLKRKELQERDDETARSFDRIRSTLNGLFNDDIPPLDSLEERFMALCEDRADVRDRMRVEKEKKQERYTTAEEKSKAAQREYAGAMRSAQRLIDTSLLEMAQVRSSFLLLLLILLFAHTSRYLCLLIFF